MHYLSLFVILFALSGCALFGQSDDQPSPDGPEDPAAPPPVSTMQSDKMFGEACVFERVLPREIKMNEPFIVTANIEAKLDVQSAFLKEDGWFREFRKDRVPEFLWQFLKAGETRSYSYEVTMWSRQAENHPFMRGSLSCNAGGLGQSEVLELESKLNLNFEISE